MSSGKKGKLNGVKNMIYKKSKFRNKIFCSKIKLSKNL